MSDNNDDQDDIQKASELIEAARAGNRDSIEELVKLIYPELKKRASRLMSLERAGHTFGPSGRELAQRVMEKLILSAGRIFDQIATEEELLGLLTRRMRDVLIDYARATKASKRFNPNARQDFDGVQVFVAKESVNVDVILSVQEAMAKLAKVDSEGAEAIELCYYGGMTQEEAAAVMKMEIGAFRARLKKAMAFLQLQISRRRPPLK